MMGSWYELVVTTCVTTPLGACPLSTHVLCTVTPQPEFSQPHSVQSREFEFNIVWTRKLGLRCDKIWFNNGGPRTAPYVIAPHLLSSSRQQPWWTLAPSKTNRRCLLTTPTGYTFAVQPLQSIVQKERVGTGQIKPSVTKWHQSSGGTKNKTAPSFTSPNQSFQRQSLCRHRLLTSRDR
jgi:hypothetical protein